MHTHMSDRLYNNHNHDHRREPTGTQTHKCTHAQKCHRNIWTLDICTWDSLTRLRGMEGSSLLWHTSAQAMVPAVILGACFIGHMTSVEETGD